MKFKSLFICIFLILQHCGYSPIYLDLKEIDYKLNIIEIKGEPIINNLILSKLNNVSNEQSEKILNLRISSGSKREILSKNRQDEITYYLLTQNIKFEIIDSKINNKLYIFNEETKIENINDQFELKKYQNEITKNFVDLKISEFILQLSKM